MKIDSRIVEMTKTSLPQQDLEAKKVQESTMDEQQELQKARQVRKEKEERQELSKDELKQVVKGLNEFLKPTFTSLNFKVHEETDRYYVEVVDQETKKVIREIPAKEILDMYARMTEYLGLFVDRKL